MSRSTKPRPPVHEIRMGRVRAAVWENETQNGSGYSVTVNRSYKDGEEWRQTSSFWRDDLPLVVKVLDAAHSWIFAQGHGAGDHQGHERQERDDPRR